MAKTRGTSLRRTWPQRLVITALTLSFLSASAVAVGLGYSNDRVASIERNVFDQGVLADQSEAAGGPLNVLLVGVDDGSGALGSAGESRDLGTTKTDTIMILRVDPGSATASILSFPRDLLVDIPGQESRARINSAFETGGPQLLVETIRDNCAIPVHHYMGVDFAGFQELVRVVDGIPIWFPHPTRSRESVTLEIPAAGCWILGPEQALGFARARKDYQVQDAEGRWHTDLGGDYTRVQRQQLFIELAMRQAIAKGARNVNTLRRLVDLGIGSVAIDDQLEIDSAIDLSRRFRSFDPGEMQTYSLPVDEAASGGPAYLYLREAEAEPTLALFRGGDPGIAGEAPPVPVDDVAVQVRNGTATANQARDVTAQLAAVGFDTLVPGVDAGVGFPTVVQYDSGSEAQARVVASYLAGGFLYQQEDLPEGVDVVVTTGQGWEGVNATPMPYGEVEAPTTATSSPTDTTAPGDTSAPGDPSTDTTGPDDAFGTTTVPDGSSTTVPTDGDGVVGDVDDPDDPSGAFFRATAPPAGATCQRTL